MGTKLIQRVGPFVMNSVRVLTAAKEEKDDVSNLKTVCAGTKDAPHPAVQVRQKYKCPYVLTVKGKKLPCTVEHSSYHPFPRGLDLGDGTFKVLTQEQLAADAAVEKDVTDTLTWVPVPRDQVDQHGIPSGKFYYLGPENTPDAANYGLIRDFFRDTADEWAWITRWAYRTAANTVLAEVHGDWIGIQQLADPASVQAAPRIEIPTYDAQWMSMLHQAIPMLKTDFDPEHFSDTRRQKIKAMIASAPAVDGVSGPDATTTPVATASPGEMLDQMRAWIAKQGGTVGGDSDAKPTPRKRAAKKPADDKPPVLEVVPDVAVVTPKKRAPRKTAPAQKSA